MKLGFHTKFSYGIGGAADHAIYTLIGTYLLFFLTSVAGIEPAFAGTIAAAGPIWEAFCGPITGFVSDNIETKYGKRKPFLIIAAIPLAVTVSLLFTAFDFNTHAKFIYYMIMTLLCWQAFSMFFVPYIAWGSELTDDYDERTELRSYAYVGNQFGMVIGMIMPVFLVSAFMDLGLSKTHAWSAVGTLIGVLCCIALLYCAFSIKISDNPNFKKNPHRERIFTAKKITAMFKEYLEIIKLKPAKFIVSASMLYLIADIFFCSAIVYNFNYRLGLSATKSSLALVVIAISGALIAPLISKLSAKSDKTRVFRIGIFTSGALLIIMGILDIRSFAACCIMCVFYTIANICYWQLMPSMLYDVCEAEALASGSHHSGQVISTQALSESLASAMGTQFLGLILQFANFKDELTVQSELTVRWIGYCSTIIPGLIFIAVSLVFLRHPINKSSYNRICNALEKRSLGEKIDMNEFKDIYGEKLGGVKEL